MTRNNMGFFSHLILETPILKTFSKEIWKKICNMCKLLGKALISYT